MNRPCRIVKEYIDTIGAGICNFFCQITCCAIVHADVVSKIAAPVEFGIGTRNCHSPTPCDFRQLARNLSNCTGGSRNQNSVTFNGLTNVIQSAPRGNSGHANITEPGMGRPNVRIDTGDCFRVKNRIFLPAKTEGFDEVASVPFWVSGFDDFGNPAADHYVANFDTFRISALGTYPTAHIGVNGQIEGARKNLAVTRCFYFRLFETPVALDRHSIRVRSEYPHSVAICQKVIISREF